jgi:ParB family chromosome partitioning protein
MTTQSETLIEISPSRISKNPSNPRRYFNDERLDQLRTSIQEVGILVPVIVYDDPDVEGNYVLMDGERRWICSRDLGLDALPANIIQVPSQLQNLLQMFNIHNVREDWPLISVALSLRDVINISGENRESRLAELTGLTRATVRRAKRLLSIPPIELDLIQAEAHLDRSLQIHREDLYLEIEAADSVMRSELPEIAEEFSRDYVIRQFAMKREVGSLPAVTDFRNVGKLIKAADDELVDRDVVLEATRRLIQDPELSPSSVFEELAAVAYLRQATQRKISLLLSDLSELGTALLSPGLVEQLSELRSVIDELLGRTS